MWNCESVSVSGELFLPEGFESTVFIDSIPETVRHIAVDATGKVYAKFNKPSDRGVLIALKDVTHDGVADSIIPFGNYSAPQKGGYSTAARIYEGYLYFSSRLAVYRYKLNADTMIPAGPLETVVLDDHSHGSHEHIAKPIAFDNDGNLYVPFGAPSNACQEPKRTPFQAGLNPCPQLIDHAGICKRIVFLQWFMGEMICCVFGPIAILLGKVLYSLPKSLFELKKEMILAGPIAIMIKFKRKKFWHPNTVEMVKK